MYKSLFGSPVVCPPPNYVVWGKERGLTKRLEIEPTFHMNKAFTTGI